MTTKAERAAAAKARRAAKKAATAAAAPEAVDTKTRTSPSASAAPAPPEIVESPKKKPAKTTSTKNDGPAERAERTARALKKEAEGGTIRVRATVAGVYVGRRAAGEEFDFPVERLQVVKGQRVLPSWMELVEKA